MAELPTEQQPEEEQQVVIQYEEEDDNEYEGEDEDPIFEFSISDPSKNQNGKTLSFWVYKVKTKTTSTEFESKEFEVARRFSHFVWLRQVLVDHFPGCIVPPLPEKSLLGTVEKFVSSVDTTSLLEYRQRALTKFLARVGEHNLLSTGPHFKNFISMTYEEFEAFKKIKEKKEKKGVTWFKKSLTREHPWITHQKRFVAKLEDSLKFLKIRLQEMVKKRKDMAGAITEFGKAFKTLGLVEKAYEDSSLSTTLLEISNKSEQLNVSILSQAERETMQVIETLTYYLGMCEAMKKIFKVLEHFRLERDDSNNTLNNQKNQLNRITKEDAKTKMADKIARTEARYTEAEKKLTNAEECFKNDIERFDMERKVDFAFMLHAFVSLQVDYNDNLKKSWSSLVPSIANIS